MTTILVLGAGRSSSALIEYLLNTAKVMNWKLILADQSEELARQKINSHPNGTCESLNIDDESKLRDLVKASNIVISLLPPALHFTVAKICLEESKNFLTASYVSDEIRSLNEEAKKKQVVILMEMGLDPGIDHMSAMREIHKIKASGGKITSFKSFTGGLVAPESDNNPWHYKFTWNPKNVITAGLGVAKYKEKNSLKLIPYQEIFNRIELIDIEDHGSFEGYANRDSLSYIDLYDLKEAETFLRGTLRKSPYCKAWKLLIQLGMTADTYQLEPKEELSWDQFTNTFLPEISGQSTKEKLCTWSGLSEDSEEIKMLEWAGFFSNEKTGLKAASPATYLLTLFERKWIFEPGDIDMIVMQHDFIHTHINKEHKTSSTLVVKGDSKHSAMSKSVGLPLGIAAKLILTEKIKPVGVQIPLIPSIYEPVLNELEELGIKFTNKEV